MSEEAALEIYRYDSSCVDYVALDLWTKLVALSPRFHVQYAGRYLTGL